MPKKLFNKDTPTAFQNLPKEDLRKLQKKGSEKGVKSRFAKKTMKEIFSVLLELKATDQEKEVLAKLLPGMDAEEITKKVALCARQLQNAISKGDNKSADFVRETVGEAPERNINVNGGVERVVYITAEQTKATDKHIDDVINK